MDSGGLLTIVKTTARGGFRLEGTHTHEPSFSALTGSPPVQKSGSPEGVWEVPEGLWEVSGAIFLRKMSRRRSSSILARHGDPKMTARWPKMAPRGPLVP